MARNRAKGLPIHGWLCLDKPEGMTSTEAVNRVRRITQARKVGHGGTLDPLATGVLPIALGEATKTVAYVVKGRKHYRFTARLGEVGRGTGVDRFFRDHCQCRVFRNRLDSRLLDDRRLEHRLRRGLGSRDDSDSSRRRSGRRGSGGFFRWRWGDRS